MVENFDIDAVIDLALSVCEYHQAEVLLRVQPGPALTPKGVLEELKEDEQEYARRPRLMQWLIGVINLIITALHFMFGPGYVCSGGAQKRKREAIYVIQAVELSLGFRV